jgi:PTS system mannose-specific IID component
VSAGFLRAYLRLLFVQSSWNYERMTGVGLGFAATPLLEDLETMDPSRHLEASVRSAEYFNSHPYLAGIAVGALTRAEYDQAPTAQIMRLRGALTSPLGALGDQFFWVGLTPAAIAVALLATVGGAGLWVLGVVVALYLVTRLLTGLWALRLGLASGVRVGAALSASWLPALAPRVGYAAALLVGLAVPLVVTHLLGQEPRATWLIALGTIPVTGVAVWQLSPRLTSVQFALGAIGLAAVAAWSLP